MGSVSVYSPRRLRGASTFVNTLLLVILALTGLSCGGGAGLPDNDKLAPAGGIDNLPPPSALRQVSYVPAALVSYGCNYIAGASYPEQNVSPVDLCGELVPDWAPSAPDPAGLAYACYGFDMTDFDRAEQITFSWNQQGDPSDLWIGLADFSRDCWSWHSLPALSNTLALDLAPYIEAGTGRMLVLPLVTGTSVWQLHRIHVGDLTSVSGNVLSDDGTTPLPDTLVTLDGEADYSAVADYNGAWCIDGVLPGDYVASAQLLGWSFAPETQAVAVSGLEQVLPEFTGTALPLHTVGGSVQQSTGTPVPGVEMRVQLIGSPTSTISAWTELDGSWTMGLPDGNYTVTPDLVAWTFSPASRNFTVAGADMVVLPFLGQRLPGYLVDGFVYQEDGTTPLADVQVNVTHNELPLFFNAQTDASGYWSVPDAIDGEYTVTAQLYGWVFVPELQTVTVDGAPLTAAPFIGTQLGQYDIDGYVYLDDGETPLAGIGVNLSGNTGWYSTATDSTGHYIFADVYEDHYTAYPADISYSFAPEQQEFDLTADITLEPFLGTALPTYQVDGYVLRPGGSSGIEGVTVTVYAYIPAGTSFTATTNASGYWRLSAVPAGYFTVYPEKQGFNFDPPDRSLLIIDQSVTVDDFIGFELPSYLVEGFVFESDGTTPVEDVTIDLLGMSYYFTTTTDATGHWQVNEVYEDTYIVTPMLAPWQFIPTNREIIVSGADELVPPFLGLKLPAVTVDGYIYEAESTTPVPDVKVWFDSGALSYYCVTNASGHYSVLLPDGNWTVWPEATCWIFDPESQLFTVSGLPLTLDPFYATPSG